MRIGEVAAQAGVSVRALRYYEEQGLLTSIRSAGGQRTYADSAVDRVRLLQSLYSAGMPSKAIAEVVLPCVDNPSADHSEQAWSRMVDERDRITADIAELVSTRDALNRLIQKNETYRESVKPTSSSQAA